MEVLLQAEQYRRKHGFFPEKMPDLPLDPYTKKQLVYHIGETALPETFLTAETDRYEIKTRTVKVNAVTVRSPREARPGGKPTADRTPVRIRLR